MAEGNDITDLHGVGATSGGLPPKNKQIATTNKMRVLTNNSSNRYKLSPQAPIAIAYPDHPPLSITFHLPHSTLPHVSTTMNLLLLLLFLPLTVALRPAQIPGNYDNIPLPSTPPCPPALFIQQVEVHYLSGNFFVIPHTRIKIRLPGGGQQHCTNTPQNAPNFNNKSGTILRRDTELKLDRNNSLINAFVIENERFFIARELGIRECGHASLPSGVTSMWMAPQVRISIPASSTSVYTIVFQPSFKYIYYFSSTNPCLYRGDARETGTVIPIPTPPSSTPTPTRTPTPSPIRQSSPPAITQTVIVAPVSQPPIPNPSSSPLGAGSGADGDGIQNGVPAENTAQGGGSCFPAVMQVIRNGQSVSIAQLRISDNVLVAPNTYSTVFAFTHSVSSIITPFIRLVTLNHTLILSADHYVYVNSQPRLARHVHRGDVLSHLNGPMQVQKVDVVHLKGLYNPQTLHGDIIVNGFRVTTYTKHGGGVVGGHALLAPIRAIGEWGWGGGEWLRCRFAWREYGVCQ